jgi:hypothetical protein
MSRPVWASWIAAGAATAAFAVGTWWGTYAAGGSDSHCYISQAEMLAENRASIRQPIALAAPWPGAAASFAPAGFRLSPTVPGAIVPICPAGLSLQMALAMKVAGRDAVHFVVPLLGAAAVGLTFVLGRRLGGPGTGATAAVLLATSPIFLYQIVQPMSDVPAAAWWLAGLVLGGMQGEAAATAAGVASAVALLTRPNLVPVVLPIAAYTAARGGGATALKREWRRSLWFGVGLLPGVAATLLLQAAMYGSPLRSGYGQLESLFSWASVLPNLARYPRWLLESETLVIALALVAPAVLNASRAGSAEASPRQLACWCLLVAGTVLACYLAYVPFDAWWYVRFLLPAGPLLLALSAATMLEGFRRLPYRAGLAVSVAAIAALAGWRLELARKGAAFDLARLEARFVVAGRYVSETLPPTAVVFTVSQSGSVRYHGHRLTVAWNEIDPGALDLALAFFQERGEPPYLLLEQDEEDAFKQRFAQATAIGALDWPPKAEIRTEIPVLVYDPADRARFLEGQALRTERVWPAAGGKPEVRLR